MWTDKFKIDGFSHSMSMNEQPQDHMVDGSIKIEPSSTKGSLRLKHDPDGSNRTGPLHS